MSLTQILGITGLNCINTIRIATTRYCEWNTSTTDISMLTTGHWKCYCVELTNVICRIVINYCHRYCLFRKGKQNVLISGVTGGRQIFFQKIGWHPSVAAQVTPALVTPLILMWHQIWFEYKHYCILLDLFSGADSKWRCKIFVPICVPCFNW